MEETETARAVGTDIYLNFEISPALHHPVNGHREGAIFTTLRNHYDNNRGRRSIMCGSTKERRLPGYEIHVVRPAYQVHAYLDTSIHCDVDQMATRKSVLSIRQYMTAYGLSHKGTASFFKCPGSRKLYGLSALT